jgi:hypothetical protein
MEERGHSNTRWTFLGTSLPKAEIVYFCQILLVYAIVVTAIVNLSLHSENTELWVSLLSSAIGYALPSPTLDRQDE